MSILSAPAIANAAAITGLQAALPAYVPHLNGIAALRGLTTFGALTDGTVVETPYYALPGDAGGGRFQWSASSTAADDGLSVIAPTSNAGAGRFLRLFSGGYVTPSMAGALTNGSANDTVSFQNAVNFALVNNLELLLDRPKYLVTNVSVNGSLNISGLGASAVQVQRYSSGIDAQVTAQSGGSLPAGNYYVLIYAYNGSTLLGVQNGDVSGTVDGTTKNALAVSGSVVSGATSYVIYYSSAASVFGAATYSTGSLSSPSTTITTEGTPVAGGAPPYVDALLTINTSSTPCQIANVSFNGNARCSHCLYFPDYNAGSAYQQSVYLDSVIAQGALLNQLYEGNRLFFSRAQNCQFNGGWQAVSINNSADHYWNLTSVSGGTDCGLIIVGNNNSQFTGGGFYKNNIGLRIQNSTNISFVGGSVDSNVVAGVVADSTSRAIAFINTQMSNGNGGAAYDIDNASSMLTLIGTPFRSNSPQVQYSVFNRAGVDTVIAVGIPFMNASPGGTLIPFSVAFTNTPALISEGQVGSRYSPNPTGNFNESTTSTVTLTGTSQSTAYPLTTQVTQVTSAPSGANSYVLQPGVPGTVIKVVNETANSLGAYPPVTTPGSNFLGLAANAPFVHPPHAIVYFVWETALQAVAYAVQTTDATNQIYGQDGKALWGQGNIVNAGNGAAGGGGKSTQANAVALGPGTLADGSSAWALGNSSATHGQTGKFAYAGGRFFQSGDSQLGIEVLRVSTSGNGVGRFTSDGAAASSSNVVNIPANSVYAGQAIVVTRDFNTGDCAAWLISNLVMSRFTGSAAIVGSPTVTQMGATSGASGWVCAVPTADTTNQGFVFTVTGVSSSNLRSTLRLDTAEVM